MLSQFLKRKRTCTTSGAEGRRVSFVTGIVFSKWRIPAHVLFIYFFPSYPSAIWQNTGGTRECIYTTYIYLCHGVIVWTRIIRKNKANASLYAQIAFVYRCYNQIIALPFFLFIFFIFIFHFIIIVVSKSNNACTVDDLRRVLPYVACTCAKYFGIIKYEQSRSACVCTSTCVRLNRKNTTVKYRVTFYTDDFYRSLLFRVDELPFKRLYVYTHDVIAYNTAIGHTCVYERRSTFTF